MLHQVKVIMSKQVAFSANISVLTMALFALTALLGGFQADTAAQSDGASPFALTQISK